MLDLLTDHRHVFIRQKKEWTEVLIDWETRNQYEVSDAQGDALGTIVERSGGAMDFVKRTFLRSHRGFEIGVFDAHGERQLRLSRRFFFLFSDLTVEDPEGRVLGHVQRRFGILYKKYDLVDSNGRIFARVRSPRWRFWTFPVHGDDGRREAVISKKWGGILREAFADADSFGIDFRAEGASEDWTPDERTLIFAAAISIDFDFFENNQGDSGGLLGD